jgi:hypothetical protein
MEHGGHEMEYVNVKFDGVWEGEIVNALTVMTDITAESATDEQIRTAILAECHRVSYGADLTWNIEIVR